MDAFAILKSGVKRMNVITDIIKIQSIRHLVRCVSKSGNQYVASVYTYLDDAQILRTRRLHICTLEKQGVVTPLGHQVASIQQSLWYQVTLKKTNEWWNVIRIVPTDAPLLSWNEKVGNNTATNNDGWDK